ncbi:MAG: hypothetical protein J6S14_11365 [Clostridia bacterium]|nr:hypothetical protein [Clostridia bacterium]
MTEQEYPCPNCSRSGKCGDICPEWMMWFFYVWRKETARLRGEKPKISDMDAAIFAHGITKLLAERKAESKRSRG